MTNKIDNKIIREIINKNFTFSDLSPKFRDVDSSTGNILCPFHQNYNTPAAKMYWNEEKEIWIIHCFTERRNFDTCDYVYHVLCKNYQKYKNPFEFLKSNMDSTELLSQIKLQQRKIDIIQQSSVQAKVEYINSVYYDKENTVDYIEALYNG